MSPRYSNLLAAAGLAGAFALSAPLALAQLNNAAPQFLSTGQKITPLAARGSRFQALNPGVSSDPTYTVGQAVSTTISPDGKTLLILTSGYNLENFTSGANAGNQNNAASTEWVFVYDISNDVAVLKQTISVPNTYSGITWNPAPGLAAPEFMVGGGNSDNVHIYSLSGGAYVEEPGSPVALGHLALAAAPFNGGGLGLAIQPEAAGVAFSADGNSAIVTNYENDSITTLIKSANIWTKGVEQDLRPGKINAAQAGVAGGEFPFSVVVKGTTAYVTSVRDRQIVVVQGINGTPSVLARIATKGNPNKMVMNKAQTTLYVAEDNTNNVEVIDISGGAANNTVVDSIQVTNPTGFANPNNLLGAIPNSLALSPDEKTLYVTDGGLNAVASIALNGLGNHPMKGMIPTAFYPNSISVSPDGKMLYIVNGKSDPGPNPGETKNAANQYILQLTKAGFLQVPTPPDAQLAALSGYVIQNNNLGRTLTSAEQATVSFLKSHIQHVIYIIRENRTYDQVLGDLPVGNGDPALTQFGQAITPNQHAIAQNFVAFDNFLDTSDVSGDGWPWSTSARTTDVIEKEIPPNYAGRGLANDSEGTNRNLDIAITPINSRYAANPFGGKDPDLMPGLGNVAAPDNANGAQGEGYIWNGALNSGLTVRSYGFFNDVVLYVLDGQPYPFVPALDPTPAADGKFAAVSTNAKLAPYTDIYFRGFDNVYPDYFRFNEWNREFQQYALNGQLPSLSLVRFMHDHMGNFSTALNNVNTPEKQVADNDYAVGLLVDAVAHSPYASNTLIFVIEDDAQDGADHVNAHRSIAYVVGPYVKHGAVDSTRYTTVNMLATIEDVLGIPPLNINDASAAPMADAFDIGQSTWTFTSKPSSYLAAPNTTLPIPPALFALNNGIVPKPLHNAAWWAAQTKGMDFDDADHLDSNKFNRVVWRGVMGNRPYPTRRSGLDLSRNREALLAKFRAVQAPVTRQVAGTTTNTAPAATPTTGGNQ